jgi:hypothetical protein
MSLNLTTGNQTFFNHQNMANELSAFDSFLLFMKISITLITISLNSLAVYISIFQIKNKKYSDCLFLSMALADLSVGIVCMPNITLRSTKGIYDLGYIPCILWIIIDWSSGTISMYSLTLLCFHRFRQIITPLKESENLSQKKLFLIVILWIITYFSWILSVVLIMPQVFNDSDCLMGFTFIYNLLSQIFPFFVPYVSILLLNLFTIIALRMKSNKIKIAKVKKAIVPMTGVHQHSKALNSVSVSINENSLETKHHNLVQSFFKSDKENRAYLSISIMSITIFIFWSMFFFSFPIKAACYECVDDTFYNVVYYLVYLQAMTNPMTLFIFHEKFRNQLSIMTRKLKARLVWCSSA